MLTPSGCGESTDVVLIVPISAYVRQWRTCAILCIVAPLE